MMQAILEVNANNRIIYNLARSYYTNLSVGTSSTGNGTTFSKYSGHLMITILCSTELLVVKVCSGNTNYYRS